MSGLIQKNVETTLAGINAEIRRLQDEMRPLQQQIWLLFLRVKENDLWKGQYKSFVDYCEQEFELKSSQSYQLVKAGSSVQFLQESHDPTKGQLQLPVSIEQAVKLAEIPEEQRLEAWDSYKEQGTPLPAKQPKKKQAPENLSGVPENDQEPREKFSGTPEKIGIDSDTLEPVLEEVGQQSIATPAELKVPGQDVNLLVANLLDSYNLDQLASAFVSQLSPPDIEKFTSSINQYFLIDIRPIKLSPPPNVEDDDLP